MAKVFLGANVCFAGIIVALLSNLYFDPLNWEVNPVHIRIVINLVVVLWTASISAGFVRMQIERKKMGYKKQGRPIGSLSHVSFEPGTTIYDIMPWLKRVRRAIDENDIESLVALCEDKDVDVRYAKDLVKRYKDEIE